MTLRDGSDCTPRTGLEEATRKVVRQALDCEITQGQAMDQIVWLYYPEYVGSSTA